MARTRDFTKRGTLIKYMDGLMLKILRLERGNKCEFHNGLCNAVTGKFHILPVSTNPRLRFHKDNILLSCWLSKGFKGGHYYWHHDYNEAKKIEQRIKELRGDNYKEKLLLAEKTLERHTMLYLRCLKLYLEQELTELETANKYK